MSATVTRSFDTPGAVSVQVSVSSPDVEVTTWSKPITEIDIVPMRNDKATAEAVENMTIDGRATANGFEVVVEQPRRSLTFGFSRGPSLVVRVRCPEGAAVDLHGASSDFVCRGTLGSLHTRTASGDVNADVVTGSMTAGTASGDIKVASCGSLTAKLASGDVDAREVFGSADVTTVSGDITIRSWAGESARLQAVSGDVALRIVPGRRVHFDVSSISGSTRSSLDPIDEPGGDVTGGVADVWIRTVSGDARIDRAEPGRKAG